MISKKWEKKAVNIIFADVRKQRAIYLLNEDWQKIKEVSGNTIPRLSRQAWIEMIIREGLEKYNGRSNNKAS